MIYGGPGPSPGPLLATSAELIAAVRDTGQVLGGSCQHAQAAFTATVCPRDDGHAAARVIDRLLRVAAAR
jgi:CDP-glycerol glycerophosphotransferase